MRRLKRLELPAQDDESGSAMGNWIDKGKGRIKEATGALTGNDDLRRRGRSDQVAADAAVTIDKGTAEVKKALDKGSSHAGNLLAKGKASAEGAIDKGSAALQKAVKK